MDSRLSGGSTQSELTPGDPKRKKGLFGKLKRLAKSRSEDNGSQEDFNAFKVWKDRPTKIVYTCKCRNSAARNFLPNKRGRRYQKVVLNHQLRD